MTRPYSDERARVSVHLDASDERRFTVGHSYVGVQVGDQLFWEVECSPLATFVRMLGWLSWVAGGCGGFVVTKVDQERGIITLESKG